MRTHFVIKLTDFNKGLAFYDYILAIDNREIDYYFYLKTDAKQAPNITVNDVKLIPCYSHDGYICYQSFRFNPKENFFQLRIETFEQINLATLIILPISSIESIDNLERYIYGFTQSELGYSQLSPNIIEVGQIPQLHFKYQGGCELQAGTFLKFTLPYLFGDKISDNLFCYLDGQIQTPLSISRGEDGHEKYTIIYKLATPFYPTSIIDVYYQPEQMYLFPLKLSDSQNMYWYSNTPPLSLSISRDGVNYLALLATNQHSFEVVTKEVTSIRITGLSQVKTRNLVYKVTLHDCYGNIVKIDKKLPLELRLTLDFKEIKAESSEADFQKGVWDITIPNQKPGIYYLSLLHQNKEYRSNPTHLLSDDSLYSPIYFGEIHCHSKQSDGLGEFEDGYLFARDYNFLQFASMSDHAEYFTDNMWEKMKEITNKYNTKDFVTLVGFEWAGNQVHRNIYTHLDDLVVVRGKDSKTANLNDVYQKYDPNDIILGAHGSISHGIDSSIYDSKFETFIEIYSMWGSSEGLDNLHEAAYVSKRAKSVKQLLSEGYKVGFTGGGDNHASTPGFSSRSSQREPLTQFKALVHPCGLTACYAPSLSRKNIIDAIRNHQSYATTGARIILNLSFDYPHLKVFVICVDTPKQLDLIIDGIVAKTITLCYLAEEITLEVEEYNYFYIRVIQDNLEVAYSSPIYKNTTDKPKHFSK